MNERAVRGLFDDSSIIVYQAYNSTIAQTAVETQTLTSPSFRRERMTWIKPSFLWMMYRSGWATKENQEHILSIKITREGFEWALRNSCLSHFDKVIYNNYDAWKVKLSNSAVRIQWDPERDIMLQPLPYRSIQIGLTGIAVEKYISEWIIKIEDITDHCKFIHKLIEEKKNDLAKTLLPIEKQYSIPTDIAFKIGSTG